MIHNRTGTSTALMVANKTFSLFMNETRKLSVLRQFLNMSNNTQLPPAEIQTIWFS